MTSLIIDPKHLTAFRRLVAERHPQLLSDTEFLAEVVALFEVPVAEVLREGCWKALRKVGQPCKN